MFNSCGYRKRREFDKYIRLQTAGFIYVLSGDRHLQILSTTYVSKVI